MRVPGIEVDKARGERIKQLRERRGLSQPELAQRMGANKRSVSSWEGGGVINRSNLRLLAEELRSTADYVLTGEGPAAAATDAERLDELALRLSRLEVRIADGLAAINQKLGDLVGAPPRPAEGDEPSVDQAAAEAEADLSEATGEPQRRAARRGADR